MARKPNTEKGEEREPVQVTPAVISGDTHAEIRMLYAESTETLRFVKGHQWKTVGATLLTFFAFIVIASMTRANADFTKMLTGMTIVLACAVIFTLILYQFWTYYELEKINFMENYFSSAFTQVRSIKSKREAHVHRYMLLAFMVVLISMGVTVVHFALERVVIISVLTRS